MNNQEVKRATANQGSLSGKSSIFNESSTSTAACVLGAIALIMLGAFITAAEMIKWMHTHDVIMTVKSLF